MKHSIKAHSPQAARFFSYKNYDKSNHQTRRYNHPNGNRHRPRRTHHRDDIFRHLTFSFRVVGGRKAHADQAAFLPRKVILFFLTTLCQKVNGVSTDFNSRLPSQASSAMFSVLSWSPRCNPRPLLPARRVPQNRNTRQRPARRNFSRRSYQSFGRRP